MCGGAVGGPALDGIDAASATVVAGQVVDDGVGVAGAYVRLLDPDGDFTAEVVTSATGQFRFLTSPGEWTLRVLAPGRGARTVVEATRGTPVVVTLSLSVEA